jgi:hypothetical protein
MIYSVDEKSSLGVISVTRITIRALRHMCLRTALHDKTAGQKNGAQLWLTGGWF